MVELSMASLETDLKPAVGEQGDKFFDFQSSEAIAAAGRGAIRHLT